MPNTCSSCEGQLWARAANDPPLCVSCWLACVQLFEEVVEVLRRGDR